MFEKRNLNYYSHPVGLQLDVRRGLVRNRSGSRVVGVSEDFLRGFVASIEHEIGPATRMVLRKCGVMFGGRLARRFENETSAFAGTALQERPLNEFSGLLSDLWSSYGFGELLVDWDCGKSGYLPVRLNGSPMQNIGPTGHVSDDLFTGILQGFFAHFIDPGVRCVQTGDLRLGSKEGTTFIVGTEPYAKRAEQMANDRMLHSQIVVRLARDN